MVSARKRIGCVFTMSLITPDVITEATQPERLKGRKQIFASDLSEKLRSEVKSTFASVAARRVSRFRFHCRRLHAAFAALL